KTLFLFCLHAKLARYKLFLGHNPTFSPPQEAAMARKPQVRYFPSRNAFYCQHQGKQHKLAEGPDDSPNGPTYLAALTAFRRLMELGNVGQARDRNTVRAVLETYLTHCQGRLKASTFTRRLYLFRPFCDALGDVAVGDLTHLDVLRFIAR